MSNTPSPVPHSAAKDDNLLLSSSPLYALIATIKDYVVQELSLSRRLAQEVSIKKNNQHYLLLLLAGFVSIIILMLIHLTYERVSISAINLMTFVHYIINIYFFYQLFDTIEFQGNLRSKTRSYRFLQEFTKIFIAFFITGNIQFYFISRPLFHQTYDPNFLFMIVVLSIPSAVIARIIFELRQAKEIALESRAAQAEAQYNLLETQMQPHFLFNSLNVLSELIYVDPNLAVSVTQQLADLYREILTNSKQKFSNLGSEIAILKKYISIQKVRFGERIRFKCDIGAEYFDVAVPSLLLQTLVENAIKHGISPRQEGGDIEMTLVPVNNMYEICVSNTGELYKDLQKTGLGTGLQNTRNRLELFYGSSHDFSIYSDGKKTYVRFRVPLQNKADH